MGACIVTSTSSVDKPIKQRKYKGVNTSSHNHIDTILLEMAQSELPRCRQIHESPTSYSANDDNNSVSSTDISSQFQYHLPANVIRTRCYRLNLNAETNATCYSDDDDDDDDGSTTERQNIAVGMQTAQIFRGITALPDGTIFSQKTRAARTSDSTKVKSFMKSQQAVLIEQANDVIKHGSSNSRLISLEVIGEFDDVKKLIVDGSCQLLNVSEDDGTSK